MFVVGKIYKIIKLRQNLYSKICISLYSQFHIYKHEVNGVKPEVGDSDKWVQYNRDKVIKNGECIECIRRCL